jgi:hypothetical protein
MQQTAYAKQQREAELARLAAKKAEVEDRITDEREERDHWDYVAATNPRRLEDDMDKPSPERQMDTHLFGLPWLQPTPKRPEVKVLFDLGPGGQHLKRFHYVEFTKDLIILIYDDRYEGDRFMPPATAAGAPIRVEFPDRENQTFYVLSPPTPRLHFSLGCLDIMELVVTTAPEEAPRPQEQQTDEELANWRDEIPTRLPGQEAALEQAIRSGQFDAGARGGAI